MKRILEIGVYKPSGFRREVIDLTDLKETVNQDTAVFIGHTTVTNRVSGQDFSDSYQISRIPEAAGALVRNCITK